MITVTEQKPLAEITGSLERCQQVYIIGCGTCTTMTHTGGRTEVLAIKEQLVAAGKQVTGWMVIPTVCDTLTKVALEEQSACIDQADGILVMSCAFGVQAVNLYTDKAVFPAQNTLFVGLEDQPGHFIEVCAQCGDCVLANTAGICPVVRCAKSLLNGPCGGSVAGRCEVSADIPCAWQIIVDRLMTQDRLAVLEAVAPPKSWGSSLSGGPRQILIES